ncbi:Rok-like winged helix domain-containing protein [Salinithrix halophila]|uniref:Repressor Rok winged helix domain-containing protein n=1 Tax=Salinithrix halophila TaxID=1485204 RepID=A0ABV8JBW8_9BACL
MDKKLDNQLEEEVRALVQGENQKLLVALRAMREENTRFILALSDGLGQALNKMVRREGERVASPAIAEEVKPEPIQLVNTKGIHRKTIRAAELVSQILQERGSMRLSEIAHEVEQRGGDFGSNPTITMKSIMKIAPAIQKVSHGRYAFKLESQKEPV